MFLVREDVCESLFKHNWGLMQSEDELQRIVDFFWSNFDCGVKNRVWYTEVRSRSASVQWTMPLIPTS